MADSAHTHSTPSHRLGARVYDTATGVEGVLVATTQWFDRSAEAAILRPGVDAKGLPWPIHWLPISRLAEQGASS